MGTAAPRTKTVNLLRANKTTLTDFQPDDVLTAIWDRQSNRFVLQVETENGLKIRHEKLEPLPKSA